MTGKVWGAACEGSDELCLLTWSSLDIASLSKRRHSAWTRRIERLEFQLSSHVAVVRIKERSASELRKQYVINFGFALVFRLLHFLTYQAILLQRYLITAS